MITILLILDAMFHYWRAQKQLEQGEGPKNADITGP